MIFFNCLCQLLAKINLRIILFVILGFSLACSNDAAWTHVAFQLWVVQAGNHITLLVETYLKVVFQNYGWTHLIPTSVPMNAFNDFSNLLIKLLVCLQMKESIWIRHVFSYWEAIGELIWPMVTTQTGMSFLCVKLSQFSSFPASIYKDDFEGMFR